MADQSRRMSLVESVANVAIGYGIALLTQLAVFPAFGLHVSLEQNAAIGAIFTGKPEKPRPSGRGGIGRHA